MHATHEPMQEREHAQCAEPTNETFVRKICSVAEAVYKNSQGPTGIAAKNKSAAEARQAQEVQGVNNKCEETEVEDDSNAEAVAKLEHGPQESVVSCAFPVEVRLKLNMDFQVTGQEGSGTRKTFEKEITQDLADASGASQQCFRIKSISPGSVVVDVQIVSDALVRLQMC